MPFNGFFKIPIIFGKQWIYLAMEIELVALNYELLLLRKNAKQTRLTELTLLFSR